MTLQWGCSGFKTNPGNVTILLIFRFQSVPVVFPLGVMIVTISALRHKRTKIEAVLPFGYMI